MIKESLVTCPRSDGKELILVTATLREGELRNVKAYSLLQARK